jgi:hypothetical protein
LLLVCAPASASVYTFTSVLDSTQQQISTNSQCLAPSINSTGTLAFLAGSGSARGIYKGSGGALTLVADTTFGGQTRVFDETDCHGPSINDAGDVAFYASVPTAALDGIYVGNGGAVATVADSSGAFALFSGGCCKPFVMINESGDIPFVARFDLGISPDALYVGDTSGSAALYDSGNSPFDEYIGEPSINDAGSVAFFGRSSTSAIDGLFVGNGGALTQLFDENSSTCSISYETGIDSLSRATYAGEFGTSCVGDTVVYLASPMGAAPLVSGPVTPFWFDPPSFNNNGRIAFNGGPLGGPNGIYTGGQTSSAVIRVGDPLFSSTVTSVQIGRQGLNDSGHVAFWYKLADGRSGYARANLIPDCQNGLDDDGDGKIDTLDAGCANAADLSERTTLYVCDDGLDNDGDTFIDFPFDPGCAHAKGKKENPQCNDGLDNDGDTFIDYPADTFCTSASGGAEVAPPPGPGGCGIGPELALALPLLAWARRRRRDNL